MRLLWLLPDLEMNAAGRQALLLAPELAKLGHDVTVGALRSGGAFATPLRETGVPVRELAKPTDMPIWSLNNLEKLLREGNFDLVHTWRLPALRAMGTLRLARGHRPRLLVSQPKRGAKWNPLDRLLLGRVDRLAADVGEPHPATPDVPLAVGPIEPAPWPTSMNIAADSRVIVCMGQLTPEHGFRDAIWAFDVLRFVYPTLRLVIIGDGPERERLMQFAESQANDTTQVSFLTDCVNGPSLLANAEVVWIPSRKRCGEMVALEAKAAGTPVVAMNTHGLEAILENGQSGILAAHGQPVELAKATRPMLDNFELRQRLIDSGRRSIGPDRAPANVACRWSELYSDIAGGPSV